MRRSQHRRREAHSCQRPCKTAEYEAHFQENLDFSSPSSSKAFMEVETTDVVVVEEYLAFDLNDIVSAVGGSLGLFLGFSCFEALRVAIDLAAKGFHCGKTK